MLRWLDWLATHPAANELHNEIETLHRQATAAIDIHTNRATIPINQPCAETANGETCGGQLIARFPHDQTRPPTVRCQKCHTVWETTQWARLGQRISNPDAARRLMAKILDMPPQA